MKKIKICFSTLLILSASAYSFAQDIPFTKEGIKVINRNLSTYPMNDRTAVKLDAREGDGLAVIKNAQFETGTIEIDLLGENNPGKSFIGVAFNIQDDETYEVIYFRPFNFVAEEQIRKEHMVQYVFHPEFTWRKLRTERTGEFEHEIPSPPNPDNWFTAIIEISDDQVKVFIKSQAKPILVVPRLTEGKSSEIALWVGHGSSGRFDNLRLTKE